MTQMRLVELKDFFNNNGFTSYTLEIGCFIRATFDTVHVFFTPDTLVFMSNGNYVKLCEVVSIARTNNHVSITFDYHGSRMTAEIFCHTV